MFGQGGHEPYAGALLRGSGRLTLRPVGTGVQDLAGPGPAAPVPVAIRPVHFSVRGLSSPATAGERELLRNLRGPMLDVGCGPGRMLSAARDQGLAAVGVDTSGPAVRLATGRGGTVILGSIFGPIPREGEWGSALLLDGNVGIGGNVGVLLERLATLLSAHGQVMAEADRQDSLDASYLAVLEDSSGRRSDPFPWARVGARALARHAEVVGLSVVATRRVQGRVFLTLGRRP